MTRFRTRKFTPRPAVIANAQDRGQALRHWLDLHETPIKAFAEAVGLSRSTLNLYLQGAQHKTKLYDLAYLEQPLAAALIEAMGVTDYEAWEVLGVPADARATFRTFRPHPVGHGSPVQSVVEVRLTEPMVGEVPLPIGTIVRIDPAAEEAKFHVVKLEDGRLYSVTPAHLAHVGGERLGGLLSAHF